VSRYKPLPNSARPWIAATSVRTLFPVLLAACLTATAHAAPTSLPVESSHIEKLDAPSAHWVFVIDLVGHAARLFDGDDGRMLGMVATTPSTMALEWTPDRSELLFAAAYYTRHTYGDRTDAVVSYDVPTLSPIGETLLPGGPPKLANGYPIRAYSGIFDGGRFMAVYNFSPATSLSIIDTRTRTHLADIATVGCGLVFPVNADTALQLCGDGTVQRIQLATDGKTAAMKRSVRLFDPGTDPFMDKAARDGTAWWFITFTGSLVRVDGVTLQADAAWPVQQESERSGWRPGGRMPIALHRKQQQLFILMHEGGVDTHKQDGSEVWVFDVATKKRTEKIILKSAASSIDISQDDDPLLFAVNADRSLDVYSANSGKYLRSIAGVGIAPVIVQSFNPGY